MLNHSYQYGAFAILSWAEFFIEAYFYPGESHSMVIDFTITHVISVFNILIQLLSEMKSIKSLWIIGSLICLSGEVIRKLAILTAKKSFHHIVRKQLDKKVVS